MDFEAKLQEFGLSGKEARVYVALLELAEASASNIAQKSGVKRATTYVVLDSLKEMGMVSTYEKDQATHYVANEPETLQNIINEKKERLAQKEKDLKGLIPELKSIQNKRDDKPTIRFFEGENGLKESAKEFYQSLSSGDEPVRLLYSRDKLLRNTPEELRERFQQLRLERGVESEAIYNFEDGEYSPNKSGQRFVVGEEKFPISIDLEIYGDSVFISTLEDPISAILIQNKEVASSLKTLFRLAQIGVETEQKKWKR